MVYIYFKARFRPVDNKGEIPQGKYTFFSEGLGRKRDKYDAMCGLNEKLQHGEDYDIICLDPQDDGILEMIAVYKLGTDVVSLENILDEYHETIWNSLAVSYEGDGENSKISDHTIEVMLDTAKNLTWRETKHYLDIGDYLSYSRRKKYNLELVENAGFSRYDDVPVYWKLRKCALEVKNKQCAEAMAEKLMANQSMFDELDRIFDPLNTNDFRGVPVHYQLTVENMQAADKYIDLLVASLYSKNRILHNQIAYCRLRPKKGHFGKYTNDTVCQLMDSYYGGVVVLEMDEGELVGDLKYKDTGTTMDFFNDKIKKHHNNIVFIFLKRNVQDNDIYEYDRDDEVRLKIIQIDEGCGDRKRAAKLLRNMALASDYAQYVKDEDFAVYLPDSKQITYSDVCKAFQYWKENILTGKAYSSYQNVGIYNAQKRGDEHLNADPYVELQEMVGLQKAKSVIDDILMGQELRNIRKERGLDADRGAHHILFTGNPGSAKTSVARLIARILYDRKVIKKPHLVECGRGDIIAQYVGHTAQKVHKLFVKAMGGVLFIDEAYSLVDDRRGSFGDEAIATIVQEMENFRSDIIVIFAGYKKPMEKFLRVNEGLRSRIGFHIDFPDYNADELTAIIKLMASKQNYVISGKAIERCHEIFAQAVQNEEFGNGRFARNLLEQAILHQARRLLSGHKKSPKALSDKALSKLELEDFDVNAVEQYKKQGRLGIGFVS